MNDNGECGQSGINKGNTNIRSETGSSSHLDGYRHFPPEITENYNSNAIQSRSGYGCIQNTSPKLNTEVDMNDDGDVNDECEDEDEEEMEDSGNNNGEFEWGFEFSQDDNVRNSNESVNNNNSNTGVDWNEEFQTLLEKLTQGIDVITVISQLKHLCDKFASLAKRIGKIIIEELFLSNDQRSIPSVDNLGIAGGEKYIYAPEHIFFKFAVNTTHSKLTTYHHFLKSTSITIIIIIAIIKIIIILAYHDSNIIYEKWEK